jgi:hypothetical protein
MARRQPGALFKTMPSARTTKVAMDTALRKAAHVTGAGSMTPARVRSQNVSPPTNTNGCKKDIA